MGDGDEQPLGRREFFRRGVQKVAHMAVEHTANKTTRWFRPPYALGEADFMATCTRCGDCITACPHGVLFTLPEKFGDEAASTPAMDLLETGCRMCGDWPCVAACAPGALTRNPSSQTEDETDPQPGEISLPRLATAMIDTAQCLPYAGPECGACAHSCPVPGALVWNGTKPVIEPEKCTGCGMCREACITNPKAVSIHPLA